MNKHSFVALMHLLLYNREQNKIDGRRYRPSKDIASQNSGPCQFFCDIARFHIRTRKATSTLLQTPIAHSLPQSLPARVSGWHGRYTTSGLLLRRGHHAHVAVNFLVVAGNVGLLSRSIGVGSFGLLLARLGLISRLVSLLLGRFDS
jgi:hypothetical protein